MNNSPCYLCPNKCGVNRKIQNGICGADDNIRIAKFYLHKFEEPIISGSNGSGTVFFSGCSLKCVFCQNSVISHENKGKIITTNELADIFKKLEHMGAHNINLVNPTHFADKIVQALEIYKPNIPIVYNTHGYENLGILKEIDKYIDVYLPDLKYKSSDISSRYSKRSDYFDVASKAITFMAKKPIKFDNDGLIKSGTVVRHLVLPMNTTDSKAVLDFLSGIKDEIYLNVMSQYTPFGKIENYPELKRKITKREYDSVIDYALSLGFKNMFYQKLKSASELYIPTWDYLE